MSKFWSVKTHAVYDSYDDIPLSELPYCALVSEDLIEDGYLDWLLGGGA